MYLNVENTSVGFTQFLCRDLLVKPDISQHKSLCSAVVLRVYLVVDARQAGLLQLRCVTVSQWWRWWRGSKDCGPVVATRQF